MPNTTVTPDELDYMTLNCNRFHFLLEIWAETTGQKPAIVVRELDQMMAIRDRAAAIRGASAKTAAVQHRLNGGRRDPTTSGGFGP
jgi:hypothetical protein